MQYDLLPASADDAEALLRVNVAAFKGERLHDALFPKDREHLVADDEFWQWRIARHRKRFADPETMTFKIVPSDDSQTIAGYAAWMKPGAANRKKQAQAQKQKDDAAITDQQTIPETMSHGVVETPPAAATGSSISDDGESSPRMNAELHKEFFGKIDAKRDEIWGESGEYWYLVGFAVDPAHQGKGLARKMLQWGFDKSEQEKLPVYLEASPAGDPVYIHCGFKPIGQFEIMEGSEIVRCMIRRPNSASNVLNGEVGQT
ncbi:hypothetical protein LTR86_007473 [Recurvomyces mirabilis]|nr:hypothetical protein LTR86_007473 [Recurvomyces mirabilis]